MNDTSRSIASPSGLENKKFERQSEVTSPSKFKRVPLLGASIISPVNENANTSVGDTVSVNPAAALAPPFVPSTQSS